MAKKKDSGRSDYALVRGLRSTAGRETTTFGFSILVTVTFGLMQTTQGSPDTRRIFLYAVGAVLSFTVLNGLLSRGFRAHLPQHDSEVQVAATSLNLLSVVAGLGAAWALAGNVSGVAVWAIAPFVAGVVYLLTESVEETIAEQVLERYVERGAKEVSE